MGNRWASFCLRGALIPQNYLAWITYCLDQTARKLCTRASGRSAAGFVRTSLVAFGRSEGQVIREAPFPFLHFINTVSLRRTSRNTMSVWNEKRQRLQRAAGVEKPSQPCRQQFSCIFKDSVLCKKSFKLESRLSVSPQLGKELLSSDQQESW